MITLVEIIESPIQKGWEIKEMELTGKQLADYINEDYAVLPQENAISYRSRIGFPNEPFEDLFTIANIDESSGIRFPEGDPSFTLHLAAANNRIEPYAENGQFSIVPKEWIYNYSISPNFGGFDIVYSFKMEMEQRPGTFLPVAMYFHYSNGQSKTVSLLSKYINDPDRMNGDIFSKVKTIYLSHKHGR